MGTVLRGVEQLGGKGGMLMQVYAIGVCFELC